MIWRRQDRRTLRVLIIDSDPRKRQALLDYYQKHIRPERKGQFGRDDVYLVRDFLKAKKKIDEKILPQNHLLQVAIFSLDLPDNAVAEFRQRLSELGLATLFYFVPLEDFFGSMQVVNKR